jgi:uncharacterized membrane protein YfcA
MKVAEIFTFSIGMYFLFALLALLCEYIDSALGGGYGTILVPVLLAFNVERSLLIPVILFTEIWTGFSSAALHHYVGNANFKIKFKPKRKILVNGGDINPVPVQVESDVKKEGILNNIYISKDFRISLLLGFCGIIGGIAAAFLALNLNETIIKTYIGILVFLVGLFVFLKLKWKFTWWKISGIGLLAAFNKGLSGGGYGPLISSGQIIVDRNPRQAVASTSLAEAVVCISSLIIYAVFSGSILNLAFSYLLTALLIGGLLSVPLAVLTVKYIPIKKLQPLIGIITMLIGIFTLLKTFVF